jgi:hypothetical protein
LARSSLLYLTFLENNWGQRRWRPSKDFESRMTQQLFIILIFIIFCFYHFIFFAPAPSTISHSRHFLRASLHWELPESRLADNYSWCAAAGGKISEIWEKIDWMKERTWTRDNQNINSFLLLHHHFKSKKSLNDLSFSFWQIINQILN